MLPPSDPNWSRHLPRDDATDDTNLPPAAPGFLWWLMFFIALSTFGFIF